MICRLGHASITSFTYDDLHRLTSLYSTGLNTNRNYSYNAIGNLMSNDDLAGGQYSYASGKAHQVSYAGGKAYTYDACGNMTGRGYNVFQYDEENRLTQFNGPSPQVTFGYTDDGTRLWRKVNGDLTVWIGGIYENRLGEDLCHVFANGQIIATFEPQGGVFGFIPRTPVVARAARTLERWFAWPLQNGRTPITVMIATLLGILSISVLSRWRERVEFYRSKRSQRSKLTACKELLLSLFPSLSSVKNSPSSPQPPRSAFRAPRFWQQSLSTFLIVALVLATTETNVHAQIVDPVFYYYHPDHLGSSNILTDRAGVIVQQYEYTAFGHRRVKTSDTAFPVTQGYTGQDFDEATGLLFYQSRYYDPEIGRFIQADSEVPWPDDPQTLNRYSYVNNNPFKYIDPTGNELITSIIVGVVVGAAIGAATAAATGGDIWMGVLTGAIGGLFGGLGAWAGGLIIGGPAGQLVGAAAGGAAGGAVSAAVTGGDVGMGALTGAIAGVIAFGAGQLQLQIGLDSWLDDLAGYAISAGAGALAGGIGAELQGGDFGQGAAYGAIGGAIGYTIAVDLPDAIQNEMSGAPRPHLPTGFVAWLLTKAGTAGKAAWPYVVKGFNAAKSLTAKVLYGANVNLPKPALKHIMERHWYGSAAKNAGKFAKAMTVRQLRKMIAETISKGASRPNTLNRPGTIHEYDFGRQIGTTIKGGAATKLRVVVRPNGEVQTAFPY